MLEVHHTPEAYQQLWSENPRYLRPLCGRKAPVRCHSKGRLTAYQIKLDRGAVPWRHAIEFVCLLPLRVLGLFLRQAFLLGSRWIERTGGRQDASKQREKP